MISENKSESKLGNEILLGIEVIQLGSRVAVVMRAQELATAMGFRPIFTLVNCGDGTEAGKCYPPYKHSNKRTICVCHGLSG